MSTRFRYRFPAAIAALGRDSIMVRRAELVLQEIQLAPAGSGECDPEEEEEACAPLEMGPVLSTLPLDDAPGPMITVRAPADSYIVFHFAIHRPDPAHDAAWLAAHPDFAGEVGVGREPRGVVRRVRAVDCEVEHDVAVRRSAHGDHRPRGVVQRERAE